MIATFRRSLGELKEMPLKADADTIVGAAVAAVLMKVRREIVISNTYIKRVKLTRNASRSLAHLLPDRQIISLSKRSPKIHVKKCLAQTKTSHPNLAIYWIHRTVR